MQLQAPAPMTPASAPERRLGRLLMALVGLMLLAASVVGFVAPLQPNISYDATVVRVGAAVMAVAGAALWWSFRTGLRSRPRQGPPLLARNPLGWSVAVSLVGSAACTLIALSLVYRVGWDADVLRRAAGELSAHRGVDPYYYDYLSRYPNNLPLLVVDELCDRVGAAWGWSASTVFVLLNGGCLTVTVQAVHVLVRATRGVAAAFVAQLLVLALIGLSPWMTVPYTDVLALPFPVLATALAVTASSSRSRPRWVLSVVLGAALVAVGYVLKTTPLVTFVACALVALLAALGGRRGRVAPGRRLIATVAVIALSAGLVLVSASAVNAGALRASGLDAARLDTRRTPPLQWWMAMGLTTVGSPPHTRYGAYDGKIVGDTRHLSPAEVKAYSSALLKSRLERLGLSGYAGFVAKKFAWNWGDGMFWAYGEGNDGARPLLADQPLTPWAKQWNNPRGADYLLRANLTQALWLLLLGVAGAGLLLTPYRRDVLLLALSVLGIALFTVVFQGRSRYLLVYVPVVIALAVTVAPLGYRRGGAAYRRPSEREASGKRAGS